MILNVISDIRNGRREDVIDHLTLRDVPFSIWDAIMLPGDTVASINASHKQIVKWAKESRQVSVVIAEDDVFFPVQDGWEYFLSKEPGVYDLYLAGVYSTTHDTNCDRTYRYTFDPVGLHCYMIHERYYDKFLSVPDDAHIDTAQGKQGQFKVCYPMAAIQRPGFSANSRQQVDYNTLLKPEDVYGGLPKFDSLTGAEAP